MKPTTVKSPAENVTVKVTSWMNHRCPFVNEVDSGQVTITWVVTDKTIELHSLAAYLQTWADVEISHEELTLRIASDLRELGVYDVEVSGTWTTAGMAVTTTGSEL